jgi:hypothetical protein
MSATITLDRHELIWLLEGAMCGSHLRWDIYEMMVNVVYPQLNDDERKFFREIAIRNCTERLHEDTPREYFNKMLSCFDEDNRYIVKVNGMKDLIDAFLWNGSYYKDWNWRCNPDYILTVTKKNGSKRK